MLSGAGDGLQIRSRLQFSQPSQATPSQALNNAFGNCNLSSQQLPLDSDMEMTQSAPTQSLPSQPPSSQTYGLGSQDYITPVDQQFDAEASNGARPMRSPAILSPNRCKRPRNGLLAGLTSFLGSQSSDDRSSGSQGPSQSTFTQNANARKLLKGRRMHSPQCLHNAFVNDSEPEENKVARPLPLVTNMFRTVFKELGVLGQGNFSRVFRVVNRMDGVEYAVKRSARELFTEADRRQWYQEVQAIAATGTHSNIVRYYFSWMEQAPGSNGGTHFFIQMEKCDTSLGAKLAVHARPFKEAELLETMRQMAAALQHLHSRRIAHMDVKPDNIYTTPEGVFKLGDFGLATMSDGKSHVTISEGDCRYVPLELLNGDFRQLEKADMFALGATLYELAIGTPLPTGGNMYQDIRNGKLMLMPSFTAPFQNMLKQLMSLDPADRPTPAKVLGSALLAKKAAYQPLALQPAGSM